MYSIIIVFFYNKIEGRTVLEKSGFYSPLAIENCNLAREGNYLGAKWRVERKIFKGRIRQWYLQ